MEDWLVSMQIQAMAFQAEMNAMITANLTRDFPFEAPVYSEADFQNIADELRSISNTIQEHMRRG